MPRRSRKQKTARAKRRRVLGRWLRDSSKGLSSMVDKEILDLLMEGAKDNLLTRKADG